MQNINQETIALIANGAMSVNQTAVLLNNELANPEYALDPLLATRVCTIMSDAQKIIIDGLHQSAVRQAREIAPEAFEGNGKEFNYNDTCYKVDIRRKYKYYKTSKNAELNAHLQELHRKEKELAELDVKRSQLRLDIAAKKKILNPRMPVVDQEIIIGVKRK